MAEDVLNGGEQEALARWVFSVDHRLGIPHKGSGRGRPGSTQLSKEQNLTVDEWLNGGYWAVVVKSTNVTGIRYDRHAFVLYVAFASRALDGARLYKYPAIDWPVAEGLFLAPSLGKYVWDRLRRLNVGHQKMTLS